MTTHPLSYKTLCLGLLVIAASNITGCSSVSDGSTDYLKAVNHKPLITKDNQASSYQLMDIPNIATSSSASPAIKLTSANGKRFIMPAPQVVNMTQNTPSQP